VRVRVGANCAAAGPGMTASVDEPMFGHRSPGLVSGYRAGIGAAYGRSGLYALGAVVVTFLGYRFAFERFWSHRDKYAEIARRPTHAELDRSRRRARELGLKFETTTFERCSAFDMPAMLEI
jgi:hypothetical protein